MFEGSPRYIDFTMKDYKNKALNLLQGLCQSFIVCKDVVYVLLQHLQTLSCPHGFKVVLPHYGRVAGGGISLLHKDWLLRLYHCIRWRFG